MLAFYTRLLSASERCCIVITNSKFMTCRDRVDRLEPFDEYAEWALKCMHYVIICAARGNPASLTSRLQQRMTSAISVNMTTGAGVAPSVAGITACCNGEDSSLGVETIAAPLPAVPVLMLATPLKARDSSILRYSLAYIYKYVLIYPFHMYCVPSSALMNVLTTAQLGARLGLPWQQNLLLQWVSQCKCRAFAIVRAHRCMHCVLVPLALHHLTLVAMAARTTLVSRISFVCPYMQNCPLLVKVHQALLRQPRRPPPSLLLA